MDGHEVHAHEVHARDLIDELYALDRAAGAVDPDAAEAVRDAVQVYLAPVRIQVVGRAGVGRTSVAELVRALGAESAAGRFGAANPSARTVLVSETGAVDAPGAEDPEVDADVVVYVLVDPPRDADRAVLARLDQVVAVLNKADTLEDPESRARACGDDLGVRTLPLVAAGAHANGTVLRPALTDLIEQVLASRGAALLDEVRIQAARSSARDVLETFLVGDRAVGLAARVARAGLPDLAAREPEYPATAEDALRCAAWWKARLAEEGSPRRRSRIRDIHRECIRIWARSARTPTVGHGT
ncbi:hypothetical protein G4H71_12715 [Rhodococcus triatomae]|uniref:Uncharacterized protein n=1 Tax=Rhodococcus triatomae TaxID=300028 RepID=A0A1G8GRM9_9NOCA|nr:hypothetical protein [Rhodococcus triatomae]QNG20315.1 hypothetical protein G4H72_17665 [Rhodococcus triatomae]QNG23769.1 hypothetical protein G4H71_12715 [Rhodococcus triatomae]SDH97042.1 hypothetical protein SAMN05444695_104183 [Rhodococcus triatomae]